MSEDDVFSFLDPNNKEQCLLVVPAGTNAGIDSLGFVVGDTMVRKGVILPLVDVARLYAALAPYASAAVPGAPVFVLEDGQDGSVSAAEGLRREMQSRINTLWSTPNPSLCPLRVQSSLEAYVRGLPPGDFIRAVLSNDLNEAIARADDVNIHALPHIVAYVREHLPAVAWGSPVAVNRWLASNNYEQRAKAARLRERVTDGESSDVETEREG